MVKTRTVVQTRTHAQKYFQKLAKAMHSSAPSVPGVPAGSSGPSPHGINALTASGLPLPSTLYPSQGLSGGGSSNGHTPFDLLVNHQHELEREKAASSSTASKSAANKQHSIPSSVRKAVQASSFPSSDLTFLSPDVQNGRENPFPQPAGGGYYDILTNHGNSNSQQYFPLESEELRPSSHSQSSLLLSPSLSPSLSSASTPLPSSSHSHLSHSHSNNPYDVPSLVIPPNTLPSSGSSFHHTRGVRVGGAGGVPPDFPQPSPAACGKRKHAELAAAQILIGSASHHHQNSVSSSSLETEGVNVLSAMKRDHNDMMGTGGGGSQARGGMNTDGNHTAEKDLPTSAMKRLKPLNLTVVFPNEGKGSSVYDNQPQTPWENELKAFSSKSSGLVINLGMNTPSEQRSVMERLRKCVKTGSISELEEILKTLVTQHYSNQYSNQQQHLSGTLAEGEQPIESNLMDSSPFPSTSSGKVFRLLFFLLSFFSLFSCVVSFCVSLSSCCGCSSCNCK
jgi:hypothetical protein